MKDDPTVLDFVELYLTQEMFTLLITESNRFAKQYISSVDETVRNNTYVGKWEPVTVPEMKKFIGLTMLMGIVYKPTIHMYWSIDEIYSTPIFSDVMSRNRFTLNLKFLHFNDNLDADYDPQDRLHKIRPLLDILRTQF